VELLSSKKNDLIKGKVFCLIQNSVPASTFFHLPWQIATETSLRCEGPFSYWQNLKQRKKDAPLSCSVRSHLLTNTQKNYPILEEPLDVNIDLSLYPNLSFSCEHLDIESSSLHCIGKLSISASLTPVDGSIAMNISNLKKVLPSLPVAGKVDLKAGLTKDAFLLSLSSHTLEVDGIAFSNLEGKAQATLQEDGWKGSLCYKADHPTFPCLGSSSFLLTPTLLNINDFDLSLESNHLSGNARIDTKFSQLDGSFFVRAPNLKSFRIFFPTSNIEGKIGGNFSFIYKEKDLSLDTHLIAKNVRYRSTLVNTTEIDLQSKYILTHPEGTFALSCENLLARGGQISKLHLSSASIEVEKQIFKLEVEGVYKQPFSISSTGSFVREKDGYCLFCDTFKGVGFNQPFHTTSFVFTKENNTLSLQNYQLHIGDGIFEINGNIDPKTASIRTAAKHLPLSVISLLYPSIRLSGSASFHGECLLQEKSSEGYFLATLEEAYLPSMQAKGSLQAHLSSDALQLHTHLYATEKQFVDFSATLPIQFPIQNGSIFDKTKPLYSKLVAEGKLHHLLDFLEIANQKIEGWIHSHLFLSGTLEAPYLQGHLKIENGLYENYFTGIHAHGLYADVIATGQLLELQKLNLSDKEGGTLTAQGSLALSRKNNFPFEAHCELKQFYLLDSSFLKTTMTGNLSVLGDTNRSLAKGDLTVDKATFLLSDKLPVEIPTLPVTYINKPIHLEQSEKIFTPSYPLNLQLDLIAKNTVTLKGRGLDSLWRGELRITGSPNKVISKGTLVLDKGEFTFSGKTFTLTRGDLSFSDRSDQEAYLAISGELKLSSATIIANLQGPLSSPRLTFQSIPQLPTSSILSLMLFNKDVSEISALEALQLAQVIMSLSGNGGPDVFGAIRKTIGVDRLQISGKEGTDEIALQIGWCIAHGVTVSLSQSATSSDITVEVDLKNGFTFEAESQNQEEGKFSLKWNCNY
jgi:translocation and assembly module TamB